MNYSDKQPPLALPLLATLIFTLVTPVSAKEIPEDSPAQSFLSLSLKELLNAKIITAASGFEQKLRRAAANGTVITKEEWQAFGARTLSDVLATVPGVHVTKSKVSYKHNIFSFRGISGGFGEQIKILIDGHPLEFMQDGGTPIGFNLPLNLFKRIEVIKGPGSAVYGADAFGGVINLVSHTAGDAPSSVSVSAGNFGSYGVSAQAGITKGQHNFNFAFDYMLSDDDPNKVVSGDLQTNLDALLGTNVSRAPGRIDEHFDVLSLQANWQWKDLSLDFWQWQNRDIGLGPGIAQALDMTGHARVKNTHVKGKWNLSRFINNGDLQLAINWQQQTSFSKLYLFPAGANLPIGADGNLDFVNPVGITHFSEGYIGAPSSGGDTYGIQLTHLFDWKNHKIRWQLGSDKQNFKASESKNFGPGILDGSELLVDGSLTDVTGTSYIYLPNKIRKFSYVSLQDDWKVSDKVQLNLGARWDDYSDFGSTFNHRISVLWNLEDAFNLKLYLGSAFRAPSLTDLYAQNNPVALGNSELKPEGVDTQELGAGFNYFIDDNLQVSVDIFHYDATDLIAYVFDPVVNGSVAQNVGGQHGFGGEAQLRWKPATNISLDINYAYLKAEDNNHRSIADIPKNTINFASRWQFLDDWSWSLNAKWVMDRARSADDVRAPIEDYSQVTSRLGWSNITPNLNAALVVKNLFDSERREPSNGSIADDFPLAGRQWSFELEYRFD